MYARCIAAGLLGLCACGEAAPVVVEEVMPRPDPWAVTRTEGEGPRLLFAEGPGLELPERVGGVMTKQWRETVVVVRGEAIGVAGVEVLGLVDGGIPADAVEGPVVPRIVDAVAPLVRDRQSVVLLADRRLRFADLVLVMNSTIRAGAGGWSVAVRRPGDPGGVATGEMLGHGARWDGRIAEMRGTRRSMFLDERSFVLAMMITSEALDIGEVRHTGTVELLARVSREEGFEPVRDLARKAAGRLEPTDHMPFVVFGADPEVPLERVVQALASVGGLVDCERMLFDRDRDVCWFPVPVLDSHARSLWDLNVPEPGSLTVTLEASGAVKRRDRPQTKQFVFSGDRCRLGREPGQVAVKLQADRGTRGEVQLIEEEGGRQRMRVEVERTKLEVDEPFACARFAVELTRFETIMEAGLAVKGFLDVECELGEVMVFAVPYRARVRGRVNFAPCG